MCSYLSSGELLHKVALLNKQTRRQLISSSGAASSRIFPERTVKLTIRGEDNMRSPLPQGPIDFADRLVIQTLVPFKGRGQLLEALFREMPSKFNDFRVKIYANELPVELVN